MKRVLVLGSGGREYAFCRDLAASAEVEQVHIHPGGDAFSLLPKVRCWPTEPLAAHNVADFARRWGIEVVLMGGSRWMGQGWTESLCAAGIPVVGASQAGAQLERSKQFGHLFMERHGLRTPLTRHHASLEAALADLSTRCFPVVVKTDHVDGSHLQTRICGDIAQATAACAYALDPMGTGQNTGLALVQEFVPGWDLAVTVALDEHHGIPLPECQEYKRLSADETGINTCGMGTFSPVAAYTAALREQVWNELVLPSLEGMRAEGLRYRGFLFFGVRVAEDGRPYLLEYNTRMGDPEACCILARLSSDFGEAIEMIAQGRVQHWQPQWDNRHAVSVYTAAAGYPGNGVRGQAIDLAPELDTASLVWADVTHFNGQFFTGTARTVLVTGMDHNLDAARQRAYNQIKKINYSGKQYRTDIANSRNKKC